MCEDYKNELHQPVALHMEKHEKDECPLAYRGIVDYSEMAPTAIRQKAFVYLPRQLHAKIASQVVHWGKDSDSAGSSTSLYRRDVVG